MGASGDGGAIVAVGVDNDNDEDGNEAALGVAEDSTMAVRRMVMSSGRRLKTRL